MDEIYRSQFRLPQSLYECLKKSADSNHRSVNAELVARLEHSFRDEEMPDERESRIKQIGRLAGPGVQSILDDFNARIELEIQRRAEELAAKQDK